MNTVINHADHVALTPQTALREAADLRNLTTDLFAVEGTATEKRAKLYFDIFHYVAKYGRDAVEKLAKDDGYTSNSTALPFQIHAQFLTGINIFKDTSAEERARRQTLVRPFALVLDALVRRTDEHGHLDKDAWLAWYQTVGQQKGLLDWLKMHSTGSVKEADNKPTPDSLVDDAFGSPAAITLAGDLTIPDLIPGRPMLVMVRQDETGIRAVPLPKAGSSALASVAGYRATGLENAPLRLRFWHLLMSVGKEIIPDATSDEPVSALEPDDEPNAATPMLPAYATYLWVDDKFSIAGARSHDTRIVEVIPRDLVDLGIGSKAARFIDKRTRNSMAERLIQPSVCAGYAGEKGIKVEDEGDRIRVKFTHSDKKLKGQLALPLLSEFGTNWTSRVGEFNPAADAAMDEAAIAEFRSTFLTMLAGKGKADAQVTISVEDDKIAFRRDKAKSISFSAEVLGSASVRVMQSDLLAVMSSLLMLEPHGGFSWELDPEGLLMVEISTDTAVVRAYIQTLENGRDTRSRKLLERVRAPQQLAPTASETPALAA